MNIIRLKALAKVNLGLDVVRKREDSYHEVRMIMQMINLYDRVNIEKSPVKGIHLSTNLSFLPADDRNIAYRAAEKMMDMYDIDSGLNIYIDKHIPVAAGMAGGSTDCGAVLFGINRLFGLGLGKDELMKIGVTLGADVPYCILRHTALSEGIGEILTPVDPLPDCHILIAKPPFGVSTKAVYQNLILDGKTIHPDIDGMKDALKRQDLKGVVSHMGNVLESVTAEKYPVINEIKRQMISYGAMGALMSGSGPTVFGIFENEEDAHRAAREIRKSRMAKQVFVTRPYRS